MRRLKQYYKGIDLPHGIPGHLLQEVLLVDASFHHCCGVDQLPAVWLVAIVLCIGNGLFLGCLDVVPDCRHTVGLHSQHLVEVSNGTGFVRRVGQN